MTQKRFVYYEHKGADYILENPNTDLDFIEMLGDCLDEKEIVNRLNGLYEENNELKQGLNDDLELIGQLQKENEQLKQFKEKVFALIDKEIAQNEEAIEWGKETGADSGSIGYYNQMLNRLKKELSE